MPKTFRDIDLPVPLNSILKFTIILCWLGWACFYSLSTSINIPTFHLDGAFQTASSLYRLDSGQYPGKDFFPYLGIAPLLVLYPFFKAFGANISASVFSAQFIVLLMGMLSTALIIQLIWRPRSFVISIAAGCFLFFGSIVVLTTLSQPLPHWIGFSASPGNSLRPLRTSAPYLVVIAYYFFIFRINRDYKKYALSGVLSGSVLLWSNDYAITSAGLFTLLVCINALRCNEFRLKNILVYLVAMILSWTLFIMIATQGHPLEMLKYNFNDVAHDQWWYFGPYYESCRIFNLQQVTKLFTQEIYLPLFSLTLVAVVSLKTKLIEHFLLLWIGVVLFGGGVIASIGGHLEMAGYFGGVYFWGMLTISIGFFRLCWMGRLKISNHWLQFTGISIFIMLGMSIFPLITSYNHFKLTSTNAKNDLNRFYVPELGGYLGNEWRDYVSLARASKDKVVFEEYWGLWSAILRVYPPSPVDSVIHALGSKRNEAKLGLNSAELIITSREDVSPINAWIGWNLSQNYWFYQNILSEWTPSFQSPLTTIWHKVEKKSFSDIPCRVVDKDKFVVFAKNKGFIEVNIVYEPYDFRSLVFVKNNLNFSVVSWGYVSIDPKASNALIPALTDNEGENIFDVQVLPYNNGFTLKTCTAKELLGEMVYGSHYLSDNKVYLTDGHWLGGLGRRWAGFLVHNTLKNTDTYRVGRLIKFQDGTTREIINVNKYSNFLNIYLNGDPLKIEKVGGVDKFVVIDKSSLSGDDFYLTDINWDHGIALRWAGFFVENTPNISKEYKVGRLVKFANNEVREILQIASNGQYMEIYVAGKRLIAEKVGLPNRFVIFDK